MKSPTSPTSATEISLFRLCPRAWAAKYAWDGWAAPPEDGRVFALGRLYHAAADAYLTCGTLPGPGVISELVMCGLPHLPTPGTCTSVEERHTINIEGVPATVTADAVAHKDGAVGIWDHKTSKDPKRYGLWDAAAKLDDTQTVLYSNAYLGQADGVWFDHVYVRVHRAAVLLHGVAEKASSYDLTPKGWSSMTFLPRADLQEAYQCTCVEPARRLYELRRKGPVDPATLEQGPNDADGRPPCDAYGGCKWKAKCHPKGSFAAADDPALAPAWAVAPWAAPVLPKPAP